MFTQDILNDFQKISLQEMDGVKLMNRTDTKYVLNNDVLPHIFQRINKHYNILEIDGERIFDYNSLYYDTDCNTMYLAHHNGKLNRYKIRFRQYVANNLYFLEVKYKSKGARTIKHRTPVKLIETSLSEQSVDYINKYTPFRYHILLPKIYTNFSRITLVSKAMTERVTIDLDLRFQANGHSKELGKVVVIELKRDATVHHSYLLDTLIRFRIFPQGFSKYCIGRALVEDHLKSNNFKERILNINKINDGKRNYRHYG